MSLSGCDYCQDKYRAGKGVSLVVIIVRTNIGPYRVSLSDCDYCPDEYRAGQGVSLVVIIVRTNIGSYRVSLR